MSAKKPVTKGIDVIFTVVASSSNSAALPRPAYTATKHSLSRKGPTAYREQNKAAVTLRARLLLDSIVDTAQSSFTASQAENLLEGFPATDSMCRVWWSCPIGPFPVALEFFFEVRAPAYNAHPGRFRRLFVEKKASY